MNKENEYLLQKEIEKKYGKEVSKDLKSSWNLEDEENFQKQIKEREKKRYLLNKSKIKAEKDGILISEELAASYKPIKIYSCKDCEKKYSNNFSDQVYIKKFGVCYDCYIKHNP